MMTSKVDAARAAILNAVSALDAVDAQLPAIRDDIERRLAYPNRHTHRSDVVVKTDAGQGKPYVTLQIEPDTGFVTMISIDMVASGDVALGEDAIRRARAQLAEALAVLDPATPFRPTISEAEHSRRKSDEVARDGLMKHLGIPPKEGPVQ